MSGQSQDVYETLSYGREGNLARKALLAAGLGLVGLVMLFVLLRDPDAKAGHVVPAFVLIIAGLGFVVFAFWRRRNPGEPMLVLSSAGIRYRLAKRLTFVIPWDEIADVDTADITFHHHGVSWRQRDVPVVLVSERFYRSQVKPDTWWHRGLAWEYYFVHKGKAVQVSFFHDVLSQPSADLRAAIEKRWRAFSRHPNAQRPPPPRLAI